MRKAYKLNVIRIQTNPDMDELRRLAIKDGSAQFIENHPELTPAEKLELHQRNLMRLSRGVKFIKDVIREEIRQRKLRQQIASSTGRIPRIKVTDVMVFYIIDLYREGYSTRAIADAFEGTVSKAAVHQHLKENCEDTTRDIEKKGQIIELLDDIRQLDVKKWRSSGIRKDFSNNDKNKVTDPKVVDRMFLLYKQGYKQKEIAAYLQVPLTTVNNYFHRHFR